MKLITLALLLLTTIAHAQETRIFEAAPGKSWFKKEVKVKNGDKFYWIIDSNSQNDTAFFHVPADASKRYQAVTVFTEIRDEPVPVDTVVEVYEPARITAVNRTNYSGSNKPGISDGSFSVATNVAALSSSSLTFTGVKVELFTERYQGHGVIDVYVDNIKSGTFNLGVAPFDTDYSKNKPTFRKKLSPGSHTIRVQSTTGQNILDLIKVYRLR